jgi:hypothetical protein
LNDTSTPLPARHFAQRAFWARDGGLENADVHLRNPRILFKQTEPPHRSGLVSQDQVPIHLATRVRLAQLAQVAKDDAAIIFPSARNYNYCQIDPAKEYDGETISSVYVESGCNTFSQPPSGGASISERPE